MLCRAHTLRAKQTGGTSVAASVHCPRLVSRTSTSLGSCLVARQRSRSSLVVSAAASSPLQPRPQPRRTHPSVPSNRYQQDRVEETLGTHNLNPASILVKELNKEIRAAKNLHELQDIFKMSSSGFDAVCVATAWTKLARLPDSEAPAAERLAFARKPLLGKTLAMVDELDLRGVSNVLWAMGTLRLDLTKEEPLGSYLADQLEGRIRQLVAGGALEVQLDATQLWFGLAFSKYPWSRGLVVELLEGTLPNMGTWNDFAVADVLRHMGGFHLEDALTPEHRRQLTQQAEDLVARMNVQAPEACKWALGAATAAEALQLPLSPSCVKTLHDTTIRLAPEANQYVDIRTLASGLYSLLKLGYPMQREELAVWYDQLMTMWRTKGGTNEAFSWLVSALHTAKLSQPPPELKAQMRVVAARPGSWTPAAADRLLGVAKIWKVVLPPEAAKRLAGIAARRQNRGSRP